MQTEQPASTTDTDSTSASDSAASNEPAPVIATAPSPAQTQTRSGRKKTVKDNPDQIYFDLIYDSDDGENNS